MWLLVAVIAALIVHGTLYPWDFSRSGLEIVPGGPFILRDAIVNVVLYVPFGAALALALSRSRLAGASALGFALSLSLETLQQLQPGRYPSAIDLALNTAGTAAGAVLAVVLQGRVPLSPRNALLACTLVFLPFRLRFDWLEMMAAAVLVFTLWRSAPSGSRLFAYLVIAVVILRGLLPGRGDEPSGFTWMPFGGALSSDWRHGMVIMLEKAAYYGTSIWSLTRVMTLRRATAAVASLLAVVEAAQIAIPGRTPEITDPLLAILLGVILAVLPDQSSK